MRGYRVLPFDPQAEVWGEGAKFGFGDGPSWKFNGRAMELPQGCASAMVVVAVAAVAAAAVSAAAAIKSGNDQQAAAEYNAKIEQMKATESTNEAAAAAQQQDQQNRRNVAAQRAAFASAGVDVGQGTPLDVMSDTATQGELSKQLILYRGQTQTLSAQEQSVLDTNQGQSAQTAGYLQAGSTLLGAAGKAYGAYAGAPSGGTTSFNGTSYNSATGVYSSPSGSGTGVWPA